MMGAIIRDISGHQDEPLTPEQRRRYEARHALLSAQPHLTPIQIENGARDAAVRWICTHDNGLEYEYAHDLGDATPVPDELIQGVLARGTSSVLYGESNSGKTFLAIDMGCAVALGGHWMNRNVERGLVVYLASESPASVRLRLLAYQRHHQRVVPNFVILRTPINLYQCADDGKRIIDLVQQVEQDEGAKCELIIGDTLSRIMAGANENSGEDVGLVLARADDIRQRCDAHLLLIHHAGKDATRGARGWSGLRAGIDTEIEVTVDGATGLHAAEITKQRDIPGKGDRIGFRLQSVDLGRGKWGSPITSCVVMDADAPPKSEPGKRPSEIAGAITELLLARGAGMRKGEIVDHFDGRYAKSAVYRELKKMAEAHRVRELVGIVALVSP